MSIKRIILLWTLLLLITNTVHSSSSNSGSDSDSHSSDSSSSHSSDSSQSSESSKSSDSSSSSESSDSGDHDPCSNPIVYNKGSYKDSNGNKIICPDPDPTTTGPGNAGLCVSDTDNFGCSDNELCIIPLGIGGPNPPSICVNGPINPNNGAACGLVGTVCCPVIDLDDGTIFNLCDPGLLEGGNSIACYEVANYCGPIDFQGNPVCGEQAGDVCCPAAGPTGTGCAAGLNCVQIQQTLLNGIPSTEFRCVANNGNQAMENGEMNDGVSHNVVGNSMDNNVNDNIIIGSIIAIVSIFVIVGIIGIIWFYKKNFKNKGHAKIDNIDDDEEDEIEIDHVTTHVVEENERLN